MKGSTGAVLLASTALDISLALKDCFLLNFSGKTTYVTMALFGLLNVATYNAVLTSTLTGLPHHTLNKSMDWRTIFYFPFS